MKKRELIHVFYDCFYQDMEQDGFTFYKDFFLSTNDSEQWLKYITVGSVAGGMCFRNCIQVMPYTYTMDFDNNTEEILYDFFNLQVVLAPNNPPTMFTAITTEDAENSMRISLDFYRKYLRPLIQDVHTFYDSVACAERINALSKIGEYNEWQSIITHAYLGEAEKVESLLDEWLNKLRGTFQELSKERDDMITKGYVHLVSDIDYEQKRCDENIKYVSDLCSIFQHSNLDYFISKAREQIVTNRELIKKVTNQPRGVSKRH